MRCDRCGEHEAVYSGTYSWIYGRKVGYSVEQGLPGTVDVHKTTYSADRVIEKTGHLCDACVARTRRADKAISNGILESSIAGAGCLTILFGVGLYFAHSHAPARSLPWLYTIVALAILALWAHAVLHETPIPEILEKQAKEQADKEARSLGLEYCWTEKARSVEFIGRVS
jgi:hypothetical protein